jgi:hypothetical protein
MVVASVVLLAVGGAASASIPDSGGVVHACYEKRGGGLRVIDAAKRGFAGKCRNSETPLVFDRQGPQGLQGPQGNQGPQGIKGDTGPSTGPATGDLTGNYPSPTIAPRAVTAAKLAPPEAWHQPSFVACNGAGSQWRDAYNTSVAYYRDPWGVVHLRGEVWCASSLGYCCSGDASDAGHSLMFTLPDGYRPDSPLAERFAGLIWYTSGSLDVITIDGTGTVSTAATTNGAQVVVLDGITFRCGFAPGNGCPG